MDVKGAIIHVIKNWAMSTFDQGHLEGCYLSDLEIRDTSHGVTAKPRGRKKFKGLDPREIHRIACIFYMKKKQNALIGII